MYSTQNTHPSSNNYGSLSVSYDPLSLHLTHSPSNISTTTGHVYPPSYYRQTSTPAYSNSLPQQQKAPDQVTKQMSSNYSVTSTIPPSPPSNPSTSNVHPFSSSSSVSPFR